MSLQPETQPKKPKEKKTPTLAGEIKRTRREYLKSILLKKQLLGMSLNETGRAQLALLKELEDE